MSDILDLADKAREDRRRAMAYELAIFLHAHEVEEYVSPSGYRFKKVMRCERCDAQLTQTKESA